MAPTKFKFTVDFILTSLRLNLDHLNLNILKFMLKIIKSCGICVLYIGIMRNLDYYRFVAITQPSA